MNHAHHGWRRHARDALAALCAVGLTAAAAACGAAAGGSASGGGNSTWTYGILVPKGDSGFGLMAEARNYYKQQGLNVQIKQFVGNVQLTQALVSGAIDAGDTAPDPVYDAVLKGADLKIIGSTLPKVTYAIIAKSDIKTVADLQGKTVGASAPGAYPDAVVRAVMAASHANANTIHVVPTGSDSQRFQALVAGRVDAAAISDSFVPQAAKNPKLHLLVEAQSVIPNYPRFYLAANGNSVKNKPVAAQRFLTAEMRGLCYATMHPDAARQVAASYLKVSPGSPSLKYVQQVITSAHAVSPTSAILMGPLQYLQQFRLNQGFQHGKVNFSTLTDMSLNAKALKAAKLPAACLPRHPLGTGCRFV